MEEWELTHCWTCRACQRDWEVKPGAPAKDDTGIIDHQSIIPGS